MNLRSSAPWLRRLSVPTRRRAAQPKLTRFKPAGESLESRDMMAVTGQHGAILPHVEAQAVFYGSDWYYNRSLYNLTAPVDGYLNYIVHSSYMDMLTNAGYGVGRGTDSAGEISLTNVNKSQWLMDSQIRGNLQSMISAGNLTTPDANRLFIVYVEPGVAIMNDHDHNSTSQQSFRGYHGAFAGHDRFGRGADIHYAVIAYPGGFNPTANSQGFRTNFDQLTCVTSHELAEAVTDPNINYKALGWYDNARGEIGDICNNQNVVLGGYVVQKESDKWDRAMTPAGARVYGASMITSFSTTTNASETQFHTVTVSTSHTADPSLQTLYELRFLKPIASALVQSSLDRPGRLTSHLTPSLTDQAFADSGETAWVN